METNITEPHIQEKKHPELAGVGYRFLAHLLDGIIIGVPIAFIMFILASVFFISSPEAAMMMDDDSYYYSSTVITDEQWEAIMGLIFFYIGAILMGTVVTWLYYAIMESSKLQGTLGKMALGIKVTKVTGEKVTFGRATGRFFAKGFLSPILYIGYIIAFFTEKKQALHDLIASTIVVKK
ncbi:RDD family protein [Bacillus safensis]|uniref:RDD family protein n=1 Tax=Bacillus safensis TaxID=561879 RepID=UPI00201E5D31|nr:RDD family protein [Bacillus safensis]MCY7675204.1 RDD family protein [Bacillus safensis]MCY7696764.1 RDD family protein [Bacillus safensis]MEC3627063.1 RDD family protein [Bacillus safensis]UQZ92631.1 RDD family protein [Bacillus safensis]WAT82117.1 RDD family protein [Bacillus safensis]